MDTFPVALPGAKAETLMWAQPWDIEPAAQQQLRNISALPWVHGVRVMPDVHLGSVIAMRDAVSPSAVGVDIGCGMTGVRTNLTAADLPDNLGPMRSGIESVVPVGWNANNGTAPILGRERALAAQFDRLMGRFGELRAPKVADRQGRAATQCGSLGGGNHFIEVCQADASG
jgi:tRNA-splicing ligase RtcB